MSECVCVCARARARAWAPGFLDGLYVSPTARRHRWALALGLDAEPHLSHVCRQQDNNRGLGARADAIACKLNFGVCGGKDELESHEA